MARKLNSLLRVLGVIVGVLLVAYLSWWVANPGVMEEGWEGGAVKAFSFAPFQKEQNPLAARHPSRDEISRDLKFIADYGYGVRSYSVLNGQEAIPELAKPLNLKVALGAWIDKDDANNQREIDQLLKLLRDKKNRGTITAAFVGNETVLRGDKTATEMAKIIRQVNDKTRVPVSTAEVWQTWLAHPELVEAVDFIAVHILPYWEGVSINHAVDHVFRRYEELRAAYPDKKILLAEVGWPSTGPWMMGAEPSQVNQARFIREFLNEAHRRGVDYTIMEAFDQPWKYALEGPVGTAWGIFNSDRELKFPMVGAVHENEDWRNLFCFAALLAAPFMLWFLWRRQDVRLWGQLFYSALIMAFASLLVLTIAEVVTEALLISIGIAWSMLVIAQVVMVAVTLFDGFEMTEMLWRNQWRRKFEPLRDVDLAHAPKVSIHVPCYNEPAEMVIETLNHLAALNYPNFEVLVVDNNTKDENVWRPLEAHCAKLGAQFRFFHLPDWPGFKAGALNFALKETAADAEIVAVIDSDYAVTPDWLASMVPYFDQQKTGLVQSPQAYRDWRGNLFKTMCNWEYEGFFKIGMIQRNERNAIIQHGTMTMIRKSVLQSANGWAEWCITEDAELGLRLFQEGYDAVYCPEPFGRGLTPDTFTAYKTQRFRWAYGAMQIIRRHWREFLPGAKKLTSGQKYHFIAGWLPWLADAAHLIFVSASIFWSIGGLIVPKVFGFPPTMFMIPTIAAFAAKLIFSFWLYSRLVKCSLPERIGAAIAGMSLSFTVGRAMLQGMFTSGQPFIRTPKAEGRPVFAQVWLMARSEIILLNFLVGLAILVPTMASWQNMQAVMWSILLMVQALPYAAAAIMAVANVVPASKIKMITAAVAP
jgi:cellulose synthase/poly-beta-1,6-N-acetylglucosamine synthase-like glycosyltransferase/exo-beta-1,3-glucanase (GH17 family)